jgi:hypothetical protein
MPFMEFKPSGLDIKSTDGFSTSMGGPAGVPSVVKAMTRLFLTQSVGELSFAMHCGGYHTDSVFYWLTGFRLFTHGGR